MNLPRRRVESLRIKTFGTTQARDTSCDIVDLGITIEVDETLKLTALVVPLISNPVTSQPINVSGESYDHLIGLELADSAEASNILDIHDLVG